MAVLQMQRIFICALKKDRKRLLELLQRRSVMEISNLKEEDQVFHKEDMTKSIQDFEKSIALSKEAYDILKKCAEDKSSLLSMLNGRTEVSIEEYDAIMDKRTDYVGIAHRIISLTKEIAEHKGELLKLTTQLDILLPWMKLDVPLNFSGTKSTKAYVGSLPNEWSYEMIYEQLSHVSPLNVEIISASKEQTCIFVICPKETGQTVFEALRGLEFSLPSIVVDQSPAKQVEMVKDDMRRINKEILAAEEEIKSYVPQRENLLYLSEFDTMRSDKYEVIGQSLQSKNTFILSGFIPEKESETLVKELNEHFTLAIELKEPSEDDDVPVLLENNNFSAPLEGVIAAYSPPGKGELDPTFVMSLFYYALFGLMLSDAGYGLIMVVACGFALLKFGKKMELPMKRTCQMYLYCGISTIFWGIVFSSYFGDLVDVVSETFFGNKVSIPPLWFIPMNEPMKMLTFSMTIGVIHLFTGLFMKMITLIKQKDYIGIIYDVVFWYMLLLGSILVLLSTDMMVNLLGISFKVPGSVASVAAVVAIIGAVGIIATNGRESRNPVKRFLKGLYALYGISGYLSDVLSYSRLLALGLATGVICMVVNKMAAMAGGPGVIGTIVFVIIVVFGHILNMAINALGAYVHTNRLQYVEFFGKFYEGGGRLFKPFKQNTKYYKLKEK